MTKMKEKTTGKWKLRVIAGVLSMGMMFPAGVLSQGWTVNAASVTQEQTTEELKKLANTGIDAAFVALEEYVPGGKVISPILHSALGEVMGNKEMSLEEINDNINGLYEKIGSLETRISDDMKAISNTGLFDYTVLTPLNSSVKSIASHMEGYRAGTYTEAQTLAKIGALVGSSSQWNLNSHPFVNFTSAVSKINQADLLKNTNLFTMVYDYYVTKSMLSAEAYDQAKPVVDRIMQDVMSSYTVLMECLMAQLQYNHLPDKSGVDPADQANICKDDATIIREMNFLTEQIFGKMKNGSLDDANTILKKYRDTFPENFDRLVVIDKGKGEYYLTNMARRFHGDFNARDDEDAIYRFNKWQNNLHRISGEMANDLAAYAKAKDMTIRQFLTSYGYDMSYAPQNAYLVTGDAYTDGIIAKNFFTGLGGIQWYHARYRGINVDEKTDRDKEVRFWNYGCNIWTDGIESHPEQGCALIF